MKKYIVATLNTRTGKVSYGCILYDSLQACLDSFGSAGIVPNGPFISFPLAVSANIILDSVDD